MGQETGKRGLVALLQANLYLGKLLLWVCSRTLLATKNAHPVCRVAFSWVQYCIGWVDTSCGEDGREIAEPGKRASSLTAVANNRKTA